MLGGHVPLETGETTRDELYLSGLEGERHRDTPREGGQRRESGQDREESTTQKTTFSSRQLTLPECFSFFPSSGRGEGKRGRRGGGGGGRGGEEEEEEEKPE